MTWLIAVLTIASMELLAKRRWEGWALGLFNQALWLYINITHGLWGFILLNVVFTWRYAVALIRWKADAYRRLIEESRT